MRAFEAAPAVATARYVRVLPGLGLLSRPIVFGSLIPLITLANAAVGLMLPMLMKPAVFGKYALVVTLFQCGLIFDMGASQLIDRRIPTHLGSGRTEPARLAGQHLLWFRLYVATVVAVVGATILVVLASFHKLPFGLAAGLLSALAGILYMASLGPACIYRARSQRRNYAIAIALLSFGLVIARPVGLAAGGLQGCFAALSAWYLVFAIVLHALMPPRVADRPSWPIVASLAVGGIPFFATSFVWAFYLTANRWFASTLIGPAGFGAFAFSCNIFSLLVGAVGGLSAFYYPRLTQRLAGAQHFGLSRTLMIDFIRLLAGVAAVIAVGIVLAGVLIGLLYPAYVQGVTTARIMLVAVPPLVVASWLMPISLSSGRRPWVDGFVVYPLATLALFVGIHTLFGRFGIAGVAWSSTLSGLLLMCLQLIMLAESRILRVAHALVLFGGALLSCGGLALLVAAVG